jgi:hypothetical protein
MKKSMTSARWPSKIFDPGFCYGHRSVCSKSLVAFCGYLGWWIKKAAHVCNSPDLPAQHGAMLTSYTN